MVYRMGDLVPQGPCRHPTKKAYPIGRAGHKQELI
uniref:Uncharacterized protein n=1 Tax=Myoviridae sp. ct3Pt8 TaxID=2826608 RepID=A0A8S5MMJ9_9CAUD|nr:MAG TPA: hypothetical protein [Myoviridae sp. ct3Pt8]